MSTIAEKLNRELEGTQAGYLLSDLGKRLFFPKGIVAQAAEAGEKAKKYNATAGMAINNKKPLILSDMEDSIQGMEPAEYITYAPTQGVKELRTLWKEKILEKNPSLNGIHTSSPITVPGLTSGISIISDLFLNPGESIVIPDLYWGNYNLIFNVRKGAEIKTFPFFKDSEINVPGLKERMIESAADGKITVLLNFPNNPTGYSPTKKEAEQIKQAVKEVAETGIKITVITDDAYFGLFYEDDIYKESVFSLMADLHENVLAVKVDGATKEDYAWGLRVGFITFAGKGLTDKHTNALEQKLMGAVRSSFSSSPKLSQALVYKALTSESYTKDKKEFEDLMQGRYIKVKEILKSRTAGKSLKEYPFNSGYFMNFKTEPGFNERMRVALLEQGIGTIALGDTSLRIAFSAVDEDQLEELYSTIFKTADSLQ